MQLALPVNNLFTSLLRTELQLSISTYYSFNQFLSKVAVQRFDALKDLRLRTILASEDVQWTLSLDPRDSESTFHLSLFSLTKCPYSRVEHNCMDLFGELGI